MTALWVVCMIGGYAFVVVGQVRHAKRLPPSGWIVAGCVACCAGALAACVLGGLRGWS